MKINLNDHEVRVISSALGLFSKMLTTKRTKSTLADLTLYELSEQISLELTVELVHELVNRLGDMVDLESNNALP